LRERREDIPLLAEEFLRRACSRAGRQVELSPGALDVIIAFDWPGNVRQLENLIERVVLLAPGSTVQPDDLPAPLNPSHRSVATGFFRDLPTLDELERQYLQHVMEAVGGNRTRAAQVLGIDRRTLYRMAERFGLKLGGEEG
jgi:DNA-binding NtrC family response regulator